MSRFNTAVEKLYKAYNNRTLNAFDCRYCAVGNICDNDRNWAGYSTAYFYGNFTKNSTNYNNYPKHKDYSKKELREIEYRFLLEWDKEKNRNGKNKDIQFKGLCAVVEYLAEIDGIDNPFNFNNLFNNNIEVSNKEFELNKI